MRWFTIFVGLFFTILFGGAPSADIVFSYVNYEKHFAGTNSAFVIHDLQKNLTVRSDEQKTAKREVSCSTFDIVLALAAAQNGEVLEKNALSAAIRNGDESFFRGIRNKLPTEKLQSFLTAIDYGNKDASNPQISPDEQIVFLARLYSGQLQVDPAAMELLRSGLVEKSSSTVTLSTHGGSCRTRDTNVAWFVGYLKNKKGEYVFATKMEGGPAETSAERVRTVTRSILEEMKLL